MGKKTFAGPGWVTTTANVDGSVTNQTIPGWHLLNPGSVTVWTNQQESGRMQMFTWGIGIGPMPQANVMFAPPVWSVRDFRRSMRVWP